MKCWDCAYHEEVPGSAHLRCRFAWSKAAPEIQAGYPRCRTAHGQQWFSFPFNFDPIWGPKECLAFSTERDKDMVTGDSPLGDLISLMAPRFRG